MTSQNSEQSLKSVHVRLDNFAAMQSTMDNLATMVETLMNRLESKSMENQADVSGGKHDAVARSPPKSPCEYQGQSKPVRAGASSVHTVDVVDVSYVPSEDENPPKQAVRMTRSKVVKFKGVGGAGATSEVGVKTGRSEKVLKKKNQLGGEAARGVRPKMAAVSL